MDGRNNEGLDGSGLLNSHFLPQFGGLRSGYAMIQREANSFCFHFYLIEFIVCFENAYIRLRMTAYFY